MKRPPVGRRVDLVNAERLVTPWWYHPVLGLLAAGYFSAVTLGGVLGTVIALPIFIGGLGVLVGSYKKLTGVWISGFTAGRASRWALALVIVILAVAITAYILHAVSGVAWPVWIAAAVMFVAVNIFGRMFDMSLRASPSYWPYSHSYEGYPTTPSTQPIKPNHHQLGSYR